MHQGGIVQTQTGEWWGISMMDHNSVGRLACLSPVSWRDGWPYFGLPGNPTRTPLTWLKPNTGHASPPSAPYQRSDDFSGPELLPVWQWNHAPDNSRWSLAERPGMLRLHAAGAPDFWRARNSLTQRTVGPESSATTVLETAGMQPGDLAGLAILNLPYGWIGVRRDANGTSLVWFDQTGGNTKSLPVTAGRIWLRTHCDFEKEQASFSYSLDGLTYQEFGDKLTLVFQLKTFQGARFALFNYNELGKDGGHADFDAFEVAEPRANGQRNPIPLGRTVTLSSLRDGSVLTAWNGLLRAAPATVGDPTLRHFRVLDRGRGRIALQSVANGAYVSVTGQGMTGDLRLVAADPGEAADFQWQQMESGDFMLLSVTTHRHLCIEPQANGLLSAQAPGATPDRRNGASFRWTED